MIDVKETVSKHSVSLDRRRWRDHSLDPSILETLIRSLMEDDETPVAVGKRRRAQDPDTQIGPSKRQKFTDVTNGAQTQRDDGEEDGIKVPAFKHTYDIAFTLSPNHPDNKNMETAEVYGKRVEDLKEVLLLCSQSSVISDRGDVALPVTVRSFPPTIYSECTLTVHHPDSNDPFLSVRVEHPREYDESEDIHAQNPVGAAHLLRDYRGVDFTFSVRLWPTLDPGHSPENALPMKISIDMEGFIRFPQITHPPRNVNRRNRPSAWNSLIKYLFPPSSVAIPKYRGETDIPFLYSALEPAPSLPPAISPTHVQPSALLPSLLPFQRRSVMWMLQREGKTINRKGKVVPFTPDYLPLFWEAAELGGQTVYLNRVRETLSLEPPPPGVEYPGGSLNEEPGLGKTVECLALILLNPDIRRNPTVKRWDPEARVHVREVHTTLIITPATLASQWEDELRRHAPSLKVFVYDGWSRFNSLRSKAARSKTTKSRTSSRATSRARSDEGNTPAPEDDNQEWCSYINEYDVCITTYNVLTNDLHVARPPAQRPRRDGVPYANIVRQRSPLVTCEWYRVIMDEVQMVGGGKTEEMVSLIPRLSSFAVSGTPARAQVRDLIHVLKFLRVEGITTTIWNRLQTPEFVGDFLSLFRRLAIRTTKPMVRDELGIPEQTRYLVPIELGRVERHFYDQNMEQALLALGFDARGVTIDETLLDPVLLRSWIRKLRGICTHPQVGQLQTTAEKKGTFKSIGEVLDDMRENTWRSYMDERKTRINLLTVHAQLQQNNQVEHARYHHALEILGTAEIEVDGLIEDLKALLEKLNLQALKAKAQKQAQEEARKQAQEEARKQDTSGDDSGKGKEKETPSNHEEIVVDDIAKRGAVANRIREAEILLHKVAFFKGDVYHTLGAKYSKEEDAAYAKAESIRKKLLKVTEENAIRAIAAMTEQTVGLEVEQLLLPENYLKKYRSTQPLIQNGRGGDAHEMEVDESSDESDYSEEESGDEDGYHGKGKGKAREVVKKLPKATNGTKNGTEGKPEPPKRVLNRLIREANAMITELLNAQTNLLWQWRTRLVELLTRGIGSDSGEDADGKEYARSLETQREAETFMDAYSVLLNDRRESLFAEKSLLAAHDGRGRFKRATAAAMRALGKEVDPEESPQLRAIDDFEAWPEDEISRQGLMEERLALLDPFQGRALKSIMVDLTNFSSNHDKSLKSFAADAASLLRDLIGTQMKRNERLDADLLHFRRAFKERVLYFRQLQEISDSVIEAGVERGVAEALTESKAAIDSSGVKIKSLQSHQRYLDNLSGTNVTGEEDDACIVCRCEFLTGYVTRCAHVFCEDCLKSWIARKEGKVCPVCRVSIDQEELQKFHVKESASDPATQDARSNEPAPKSKRVIEYNNIDPGLFSAIGEMQCFGSYGTKIEMLIRHLLYLQKHEPDAKSIVFSAWADSLHIIGHALKSNGIPSIRIDKGGKGAAAKVFQKDPGLRVMLLHGERENAGLNIVCASRVFLVESVVNHAFEVQAIARIDRLSQTRSTQVFCYYAKDTIERNILDLAARQGLSLYTKQNSAGNLTNAALAATTKGKSGQKGDFISSAEDMLAILFPHLFEDLEYLVPPDGDVTMEDTIIANVAEGMSRVHVNAEAGPSRLR